MNQSEPSKGTSSAPSYPAAESDRTYEILMIAPTPFFSDYGCHVRILEEARVLQRLGHRVTLCTYHIGQNCNGLVIERTPNIPWRHEVKVGASRRKIIFDAFLAAKSLVVSCRRRPDVIHAHLHEGALIGYPLRLLWGCPLVFDFQGSLSSEMLDHNFLHRDSLFYGPTLWLEQFINSLPDAIITSSHHAADLLMEDLHSDGGKIRTVPDCVDPYFFRPQPRDRKWQKFRERLGIPADRRVVVYLGLLAEYQGTGILLQAARRVVDTLGNVHFLIMGYPAEEVYRAAATGLGLEKHVTFTGRIPYEQAPKCLAQGDIAVAPKLSATEGQGKLLNYMATGLPIVAFDVPVSREYLGDLGVYARPGDADALAEAICSLLSDENKMGELGQTLRERAKHNYSWEAAGKEIVDIYETCLAN